MYSTFFEIEKNEEIIENDIKGMLKLQLYVYCFEAYKWYLYNICAVVFKNERSLFEMRNCQLRSKEEKKNVRYM